MAIPISGRLIVEDQRELSGHGVAASWKGEQNRPGDEIY